MSLHDPDWKYIPADAHYDCREFAKRQAARRRAAERRAIDTARGEQEARETFNVLMERATA